MNKKLLKIIILIITASVFLLERNYMFGEDVVGVETVSSTIYIGLLLLFSLISALSFGRSIPKVRLTRRFMVLMLFTYAISLFMSVVHPFGSRNTYFFIILPLLLYLFACSINIQKDRSFFLWMMTIVAVLLWLYYIFNYYNNIFYNVKQQYNASYSVLYLLPFLLCHKNKVFRWVLIAMVIFVVMISLKRGGFVAIIVAIAVYFLISFFYLRGKKFGIGHALILIGAVISVIYLVQYVNGVVMGDMLFDRLNEIQSGEGSGRIVIYYRYLEFIQSDDLFHLLFGHGWQGSILDSGIRSTCHNDFLEVFVDFGLIGFITYISFWISLIKLLIKMVRRKHDYAPAMGASIAIFFVNSMVAHIFIYSWYMVLFALFWGFIVSTVYEEKSEKVLPLVHE